MGKVILFFNVAALPRKVAVDIYQLLNSVIAKYGDLSVASRSIICFSLRLRQIPDLLATDESGYFAQPRSIIDLFSLYILFSHFRPRDALTGIFLLFFR